MPQLVSTANVRRMADDAARFWNEQAAYGTFDVVLARHVLWAVPDIDAALVEWVALLRPGGRLLLVEGRWHTGAGLRASDTARAVSRHRREAKVTDLDDPDLWGGPTTDERYLLVSRC